MRYEIREAEEKLMSLMLLRKETLKINEVIHIQFKGE